MKKLLESINRKVRSVTRSIYLFRNRLHFIVQIKKTERFFKLILSERYKKVIGYSKYTLTLIGLISSVFIFPNVIYSLLFALSLFLIQSIIERTIFSYVSIYIQPMPDFEIFPDKWLGMVFGYAVNSERTVQIPTVGMLFNDEEYAKKIYNLILGWNYGELRDKEGNISMSVILRDHDKYVFFAYPSMNRETVKDFFNGVEKQRREESLTDIQFQLLAQLVLGKGCKITSSSYLPTFVKRYRSGIPFYFQVFVYKDGQPQTVQGLKDIVIGDLKIKKEAELTRKDLEYDMIRFNDLRESSD